jgi:hypothetical protein
MAILYPLIFPLSLLMFSETPNEKRFSSEENTSSPTDPSLFLVEMLIL